MNNRILKRPMFRKGGSAGTGITSGLDTPKRGLVNEPGSYAGEQDYVERALSRLPKTLEAYERIKGTSPRGMPGSISSLLTSTGLNILAQPGGQSIFQTIGRAGAAPFQQFQATRAAEEASKRKLGEDLLSSLILSESDIEQEKIKAGAEGADFEFMAKQTALKDLQQQEDDIMKRLNEAKKGIEPGPEADTTIKELERELEKNQDLQRLITKEEDQIAKAILAGVSTGEFDINDYIEYKSDPDAWLAKQREGAANGGRIGYLGGGQTGLMPELSDVDTDEVQDLSYSELRARLPQEISNEVVQVLSSSKKALLDFANISTQQDVDNFNQQYGVSLSLPQEA